MILVSVVDVVVVVVVDLFADDISGLGRLVVLTVETRSQILLRALAGELGAAGGTVVDQPRPARRKRKRKGGKFSRWQRD